MATKKPTIVLIDAHAIIHRAYHALPELSTPSGDPAGALYGLSAMLIKLARELSPDYMVAAYDLPGPTHRHDAYKEYKGTRSKTEDALVEQLGTSREVFEAFHIPIYEVPGFEADDVIGTLSKQLAKKFRVIIASGDMDTLQLVQGDDVQVLTLRKGLSDTVLYNETAVQERYGFSPTALPDYKGLRGDPSDNIIGIKGIGDKTATTLISHYGTIEKMYRALEKDSEKVKKELGITERVTRLLLDGKEEAEFSKVLATIRMDAPVTFEKEEANWKKDFDRKKAVALLSSLGFRSLISRVDTLGGKAGVASSAPKDASETEAIDIDETMLAEASVMLWLTSSETTNPSLDDILHATGSKSLEDAHKKLLKKVADENLETVYCDIEKPLIPIIKKLNAEGVQIDREYLKKLSKEYHAELDVLSKEIFSYACEEFNINSPKQLGAILFEKLGLQGKRQKKTATGQFSTKESELVKLKGEHKIIESILAYRELQKLLSTYIDAIPSLLDANSRLHTTFVQTGTTTGRLSSREPNLQNIPIKSELGRRIRKAFIAPKGKMLLALDYSQIELRLAAILSGDEKLKKVFKDGEDVHSSVASEVFGVPLEKVTYEMRRSAKVINFGILYGMGVNALKETLGTNRTEAQSYLNRYFELYPGLASYLTKVKAEASRIGYVTTLFGRKRFFPGIRSHLPQIRASAERMAINAPMQGTQADVIKIAMAKVDALIEKDFKSKVALVLQIHDELIFEIDNG
ncbi:hypothetical protein COU15_02705, partial [Candidatus Kaiserbacteria bacterium CG10_big_fil_rev_8_21_14_0_10_45_20]